MSMKMSKNKSSVGAKSNRVLIGFIALIAVLLFGVFLFFTQQTMKTETYYQLAPGVSLTAQQVITEDLVVPIVTKEGTAPTNAISLADIQSGYAMAKYPLIEDEVLTLGNVGGPTSSNNLHDVLLDEKASAIESGDEEGAYKNWVLTTFSVPANNAVGGQIQPGDYFDMMVVGENGSFYPFINMKSVDAAVASSGGGAAATQGAPAEEGAEAAAPGSSYTVQLSPKDAARLHWILNNHSNVMLLLNDKSDIVTEDGVIPADGTGANSYESYNPSDEGPVMETISPNINLPGIKSSSQTEETSDEIQDEQAARQAEARSSDNPELSEEELLLEEELVSP